MVKLMRATLDLAILYATLVSLGQVVSFVICILYFVIVCNDKK